jgi:hypothetical protein
MNAVVRGLLSASLSLLLGCGGPAGGADGGSGGAGGGAGGGGTGGGTGGSGGGTGGGTGGGATGPKTVFITRADFTGALGGLTGADGLCVSAATAAGRPGAWRAYVASDTATAVSRIAAVGPWRQRFLDGGSEVVFASTAEFATGPLVGLTVDETGAPVGDVNSWTGTNPDGTADVGYNCQSFTSASNAVSADYGASGQTGAAWHHNGGGSCDQRHHLICFQQ